MGVGALWQHLCDEANQSSMAKWKPNWARGKGVAGVMRHEVRWQKSFRRVFVLSNESDHGKTHVEQHRGLDLGAATPAEQAVADSPLQSCICSLSDLK